MQLVYIGFSHDANFRSFRFQRVMASSRLAPRSRIVEFTVRVDLQLFIQHGIPVQDGPSMCLRILTEALATEGENETAASSFVVTKEHFSAMVTARTAVEDARAARRKPRHPGKPSSASQLNLPPRIP